MKDKRSISAPIIARLPPTGGLSDSPDGDTDTFVISRIELTPVPVSAGDEVAWLVFISGPYTGRIHELDAVTTIGRSARNDVSIQHGSASRRHARITRDPAGHYVLEDLSSRNGTYVNGARVTRRPLESGDHIQIGVFGHLIRFTISQRGEEQLIRQLYHSSTRDPLTGALNRRHFEERLFSEIAFARRHRTELALLMLDLDHFKRINDTWGHQAGDAVLTSFAGLAMRTRRAEDIFARFGGEEFVVLLRNISLENAVRAGERLRRETEQMVLPLHSESIRVTISVGASTLSCCGAEPGATRMIAIADERMYRAKALGRNRVCGG